jgi:hypothetical protein
MDRMTNQEHLLPMSDISDLTFSHLAGVGERTVAWERTW